MIKFRGQVYWCRILFDLVFCSVWGARSYVARLGQREVDGVGPPDVEGVCPREVEGVGPPDVEEVGPR